MPIWLREDSMTSHQSKVRASEGKITPDRREGTCTNGVGKTGKVGRVLDPAHFHDSYSLSALTLSAPSAWSAGCSTPCCASASSMARLASSARLERDSARFSRFFFLTFFITWSLHN